MHNVWTSIIEHFEFSFAVITVGWRRIM